MKFHSCGIEGHLIGNCPNRGAGKGQSSGSGAPFSGLAFGPSQPSPGDATCESLPTEAGHRGGDLPPWASDDLFFDPPSSIFASLGTYDHPPLEDPWITQDPWAAAARRNQKSYTGFLFGLQPPQPSGSQSSRGGRSAEPARQPPVRPDDALSDTPEHGNQRGGPALPPSPFASVASSAVPRVPLPQRTGTPVSDQQLLNILRGNELSQPLRSERESRPAQGLLSYVFQTVSALQEVRS